MNRPSRKSVSRQDHGIIYRWTRKFTRFVCAEQRGEAGLIGAKCSPCLCWRVRDNGVFRKRNAEADKYEVKAGSSRFERRRCGCESGCGCEERVVF